MKPKYSEGYYRQIDIGTRVWIIVCAVVIAACWCFFSG